MHLDTSLTRSRHALKRERNRGLRGDDIDLILAYAELVRPAGNGCEICTLGRRGYLKGDVISSGDNAPDFFFAARC